MNGKLPGNKPNTTKQLMQMQMQSLQAAMVLHDNLESVDLLDLTATAAYLYDLLTKEEDDKLGFKFVGKTHSRESRRDVIIDNWRNLFENYNSTEYTDPSIKPMSIKDLLIKYYWLSYIQLPYNEDELANCYLNWDVFREWLTGIYAFEDGFSLIT